MPRPLRMIVLASMIGIVSIQAASRAADVFPPPVPPEPVLSPTPNPSAKRLVGVAGCMAASCHGGRSLIGGEAKAWLSRDVAHRRAYDVLFNETSQQMAIKLDLKKPAHQHARCLACHSMGSADHGALKSDRFAVEYGVGCESCHGAAGDWLTRHTERTWKSLSASQKSDLGFRDLRSANARVETCVACHVGSPHTTANHEFVTVDHDLIAAGHPRLAFEMSAYHALLPKHWDSAAELRRDPIQEVRLWVIGQGVSARAMSDIAIARAESAMNDGFKHVIPDLAEFDCHACHHDLTEPTRGRSALRDSLGSPRWGSWIIPTSRFIAHESQRMFDQDGSAAEASLEQLVALMKQSKLGVAPADQLLRTARQSSIDLETWSRSLENSPTDATRLTQLLQRLLATESDSEWLPTWDGQTQRYLAVIATRRTLRAVAGREPFTLTTDSNVWPKLREQLRYPLDSSTPQKFHPAEFEKLLRELQKSAAQ